MPYLPIMTLRGEAGERVFVIQASVTGLMIAVIRYTILISYSVRALFY